MKRYILPLFCLLALAACKGKQAQTAELDDDDQIESTVDSKAQDDDTLPREDVNSEEPYTKIKKAVVGKWQDADASESPICFEIATDQDGMLDVLSFGYYGANSEYDAEANVTDSFLVIEAKGPQGTIELSLELNDDGQLEGGIGITDSNGEQADGIITMKRGWPE